MNTNILTPGRLAQVACVLEASARKPGNVHRFADFEDTTYLDFVLSALAIGPALDQAAVRGIGATVLDAVIATRDLVSRNTNLGMILLLAPLAAVPRQVALREGLKALLQATTIHDASAIYQAIRLARPGGLGTSPTQDVADEPSFSLFEVMRLAADRDAVARQYSQNYCDVFDHALPALTGSLASGHSMEVAIVTTHLRLLADFHDTLILRKRGQDEAREASRQAANVLEAGWPDSEAGLRLCAELDRWFRVIGNARNPGATADLVTAALFVALRDGTISLPMTTRF